MDAQAIISFTFPDEADWIVIEESSQWSGKIDLSFQHEEFLNLPGHGDIKAIVEQVGHTIHVFVEPVSRIEFSAKDIRSRIAYEFDQENKGSESPALNRTDEGKCAPGIEESFATVVEESMSSEQSFVSVLQSPDTISKSTTENQTGLATKYHSMVDDCDSSRQFHQRPKLEVVYNVFIEELSLALSDDCNERENERDEFLRITLDAILLSSRPEYHFAKTLKVLGDGIPKFTNVTVCVYNIQIDNQMFNRHPFEFPLILVGKNNDARTRVPHSYQTEQLLDELRESSLIVVKLQFDSNGDRAALKTVKIQSAPLCAFIEDKFAYKLISVLASFQQPSPKSLGNSSNQSSEPTVISEDFKQPLPPEIRMASSNMINHLRLDEISVEAFDVSLSVHASIKMYIGLDQSPLNFSQFYRSNLFTTNYCLGQMLARHYISGALFRAGWVVGSLDLIGSPAGFTRTLGDGLKDFVSLPYQGIMLGPWAFLGGMASGSSSLLKHVSAGTLTSMTNFASSVSRNLDRLSLDQEHCQRNEVFRREKPQGLGQGLVNGLSGVGISLLGAVGGIAHHPINALLEQGLSPTGFVGGITKGLVGVVTKPLGGAAEFVAQTGQGLLHGTGWSKNLKPRYPAIPDHSCTFYSGNLKFSWKLIAGSNLHDTTVLFMVDVMYGSTQATLVLTPEALFIISAEEDAQEAVFHINELDCLESKDDPTKFTICIKSPGDPSGDGEAGTSVKDRITQFVLDTGVHCTVSDIEESDTCLDESNSVSPAPTVKEMPAPSAPTTGSQGVVQLSNKQEFTFYSSPLLRTTFIGLFQLVRRQINHKGFDMLS